MKAGPGNDTIRGRDGLRDLIECGKGHDTVIADAIDFVDEEASLDGSARSCERVLRSSPARAIPTYVYGIEGDSTLTIGIFCPFDGPRRCIGRFEFRIGNRILGPAPLRLRRGQVDWWESEIGARALERLDGEYGRAIVRTYDARGVLRTASLTLKLLVEPPGCGDC